MTLRIYSGEASRVKSITYVDSQAALNPVTQNTLTLTKPTSTVGDYLIAYVFTADSGANPTSGNWSAPSGWTQLFSGSKLPNLDIYYKVATSNEPTSYTWTFSRSNFYLTGVIFSYRNVAGLGLVGSTNISSGTYTSQTAPGGTINYSNALVLASFLNTDDTESFITPTGYDLVRDNTGLIGSGGAGGGGGGGGGTVSIAGGITAGGSLTAVAWAVYSKIISSFTIPSVTATLGFSSSSLAESTQIYLLDKSNVTLLSSYSQDLGTVGINVSNITSNQVTVTSVGGSNAVTCPTGITFDKNGNNTFVSSGTVVTGDVLRFRVTTTVSTYNQARSFTIPVGSTNFVLSYDTNNYAVFTATGTSTFTVPAGVTSISMLAVGAGGGGYGGSLSSVTGAGGAGGGALSYTNNITVTPGSTINVSVGAGGSGGNGQGLAGAAGGASWASTTSVAPTTTAQGVLARGGNGTTSVNGQGSAGGQAASGIGATKYNGGNGSTASDSTSTNGCSGGSGGGAANTAGPGLNGTWYRVYPGTNYFTGGQGGQGTSFSVGATGSWSTVPADFNQIYNGGNGYQYGGGGGSAYSYNSTTRGNTLGGDGKNGIVILIWGRTFSSGTTF